MVKPIYIPTRLPTPAMAASQGDRHPQHKLLAQPYQGADAGGVTHIYASSLPFLAITILFILHNFVKKPLDRIMDNMSRVEKGDLSVRIDYRGKDEIGR